MKNVNAGTFDSMLNARPEVRYQQVLHEIEAAERFDTCEIEMLEQCFAIVEKYRNGHFPPGRLVNTSTASLKLRIDALSEYYSMRYKAALFKPCDEMQYSFYCMREIDMIACLFEKHSKIYEAVVSGAFIHLSSMGQMAAKIMGALKYQEYLQVVLEKMNAVPQNLVKIIRS